MRSLYMLTIDLAFRQDRAPLRDYVVEQRPGAAAAAEHEARSRRSQANEKATSAQARRVFELRVTVKEPGAYTRSSEVRRAVEWLLTGETCSTQVYLANRQARKVMFADLDTLSLETEYVL